VLTLLIFSAGVPGQIFEGRELVMRLSERASDFYDVARLNSCQWMASVGNYCWQAPLLISRAARIVGNESTFVMLGSDCEVNVAGYDSYDDLSVFVILSVS